MRTGFFKATIIAALGAFAFILVSGLPARAGHQQKRAAQPSRLIMPIMNPEWGKRLFVDKGCIACHAINGVGGHDAPPMDDHVKREYMNPFEFAARMWNHAPGMIAAQEGAFGEQIFFTGEELANITAFVHDDNAQHTFSEKDLTEKAHKMMAHEHGGQPAPAAHAEEIGHEHAPGTKPHKD